MDPNYKKLFAALATPEPPADLTEKILVRIGKRERKILAAKITVSACVFGVSIGAAIAGCMNLIASLSHSGSLQIASLMFSDFSTVAANFPDFILSVTESFPIFTAAVLLAGVMFAVWSLAVIIDETSLFRAHKLFAA